MGKLEMRVATDDDWEEMVVFDGLAFGEPWPEAVRELARATLDLDRFRVVRDGKRLVGVGGSYGQEVTVPGGAQVAAGGVTWIAVAPTHRRQGVLRTMMAELHDDIGRRSEPIAMLTASEGGIYRRFGYGVASYLRATEIDPRRTQIRTEFLPPTGSVVLTELGDPQIARIFDRYRRGCVGEINRTEARDALVRKDQGDGVQVALHADGYVAYKVTSEWNDGHPAFGLRVFDMVAITPEAHAALWHTVLSVDLVGTVTSLRGVAIDDALPFIVNDQRAIRTTNINDLLWLNIRDIRTALGARTYFTDDSIVVEVDHDGTPERWRIDGSPGGASVTKVRAKPDLVMDDAALGAIYLGGIRPSTFARNGQVRARSADVLRRADAFFLAERAPHCITAF